tara:strand:- start:171 stop:338 length:168 start_codon:yes stop_codon:yes gene_type:complete
MKVKIELDEYLQGQLDLISDIKSKVAKFESTTTIDDLPFDIIYLLKSINPVDKKI